MSNELTVSTSASFVKGTKDVSLSYTGNKVTVSGGDYIRGTQTITLSGDWTQELDKGNITTIGYVTMKNLDASSYVEFAAANDGSNKMLKLKPGQSACFPSAVSTIYCIAEADSVEVEYLIIED